MKKALFLFLLIPYGQSLFSQTPVDTILAIQNIDVEGRHLTGIGGGEIKRLQVDHLLSSMSATAADAFRQIPSLTTDIEGGITFRGSTRPGMLIDGIPYGLLEEYSGDVLIQLPALFFNKITLSQYPAVTQVPDGAAGVLNLSASSYGKHDSPLLLIGGAGWNERYNAGAIVNLNPKKFELTAKYTYRKEFRERMYSKSTTTSKNRTEMNNNASARPDVHLADLRVGYEPTDNDRITVRGLYYRMAYGRYGRINNQVFNLQGDRLKQAIRNRYNDQRQEAYAAEAAWHHLFANASSLSARFNYNNFAYAEANDFKNENPDDGKIVAEDNQFINQHKHHVYWSLGYELPLTGDWSITAGYIGRARREAYDTEASNKAGGVWVPNKAKIYRYQFQRSLHLFYAALAKRWRAIEAEVGVQAEFNRQTMEEHSPLWASGMDNQNNRFQLYPRARLSFRTSQDDALTVSYQQRVIRPLGAHLSSFIDQSDATHLMQGNPSLKDEFVHTLELSYQVAASHFRFTPALYYRNRANRIMEVATQVEEETVWMKENVGHSQTLGVDLSAVWNPSPVWSVGLAGNVYRDEIDGRATGSDDTRKSLLCYDFKGSLGVRLTPETELQLDGFYLSDQLTPQGKIASHYSVNAGLSHYFMQRKLRANLSVNNLFDSLEETTVIDTEHLQLTQRRNRDARVAWVTLTYSFF